MAKAAKSFEKCPKCGIRPSTPGRNRWCAECNNEYAREYYGTRVDRLEGKGFARGVDAMRQAAAEHFERFRYSHFSGYEVARMIGTIPAPRFQDERQPEAQPAANGG